jgi:PAS domain S-box-containing protein
MKKPYDGENNHESLRERIIGLGEHSVRKSYYPELQERLAELEKFRSLLDQSNDAIFLVQIPSGILMDLNESACSQLGYKKEDLMNRPFGNITDDERIKKFLGNEKILQGERQTLNIIMKKRNSQDFPVEMTVRIVNFNDIGYAVIVARDITERIKAEEEKKKLQTQILHAQKLESLGVLAGGIAHDFNNILTGILGHIDLALTDLSIGQTLRNRLEQIRISSIRAAELTRQMLAYAGLGKFSIQPVNLSHLVKDTEKLLEVSIPKRYILKYNFQENLPLFYCDISQLHQVIINLVINASEAIGEKGGIITINTGTMKCDKSYLAETYLHENLSEGLYIYLEVTDSGCGIPEENQDKIFDPFFTTKFTGRGLGLAAVLGVVKCHKGTIKIISEPEKGTAIRLLFPAFITKIEEKTEVNLSQWNGKILVVDDEECVCIVTKVILKKLGFTAMTASNGKEGLELLRKHGEEICAIILDITMPKMDGIETLKEIRLINNKVKIILTSGYENKVTFKDYIEKETDGFLQKPFEIKDMVEIFEKILPEAFINEKG